MDTAINKQRLSAEQKDADDQRWYKEHIDNIITNGRSRSHNGVSERKRKKVNYELYNNILDLADFEYVCKPYGAEVGELPAKMVNRDILSGRIKAIEGMEMKRPFPWKAIAVNRDATTRKEEATFGKMREYVINSIMAPIQERIQKQAMEQTQGRELNDQEKEQLQAQIKQEFEAQTPDRVKRYMERDHQDPAEVMANQILSYLIESQKIKSKFAKGWKHAQLGAEEVYYVGVINDKPVMNVVNALYFNHENHADTEFIEDGSWCSMEYRLSPVEIATQFPELTDKEIDELFEKFGKYQERMHADSMFSYEANDEHEGHFISVHHCCWKGLRKIGFLTYVDENGEEQLDFVDEHYRLNLDAGDLHIDWEWIPECYEGWKIGSDIYTGMGPVIGQTKDTNNLYDCPLPYKGVVYDNMNAEPTSTMDRMKIYQYYYNIIMYRLELLLASDKGKKILMNIKSVPTESGIDIEKWQYLFESTPFMWFNPDEEGGQYQDANTLAKVIDMSMASDIAKYVDFASYLKEECGKSVGITDVVLGDVQASAEVGNTRQQLIQTSNILEPMFNLHSQCKRNVLQSLIEVAKVAYSHKDPGVLSYILDDMSHQFFTVDQELLDNSTIGIFVTDSSSAEEAKETIRQLSHAAMQNDKVKLSAVAKVARQDDPQEAEEILRVSEKEQIKEHQAEQEAARQSQEKMKQMEIQDKRDERAHDKEMLILEENMKTDRELKKQAMLSTGFNENKDMDNDGQLDVMEIYQNGVDADLKMKEHNLNRDKFEHDKKIDKEKIKVEKAKANSPKGK